jgi:hypothetical protein
MSAAKGFMQGRLAGGATVGAVWRGLKLGGLEAVSRGRNSTGLMAVTILEFFKYMI